MFRFSIFLRHSNRTSCKLTLNGKSNDPNKQNLDLPAFNSVNKSLESVCVSTAVMSVKRSSLLNTT